MHLIWTKMSLVFRFLSQRAVYLGIFPGMFRPLCRKNKFQEINGTKRHKYQPIRITGKSSQSKSFVNMVIFFVTNHFLKYSRWAKLHSIESADFNSRDADCSESNDAHWSPTDNYQSDIYKNTRWSWSSKSKSNPQKLPMVAQHNVWTNLPVELCTAQCSSFSFHHFFIPIWGRFSVYLNILIYTFLILQCDKWKTCDTNFGFDQWIAP